MARVPRILIKSDEAAVYHLISRTALPGFPLDDAEKDYFLDLVRKFSCIYFVEILGFCIMGNHFHVLARMFPGDHYSEEDIRERFERCYGPQKKLYKGQIPFYRGKWSNLSEFMGEIKSNFSRYFNKKHERVGYFWGDRFKSVVVENGETLINCLAYIDLNPVRAGLVDRPEDYRWSSIGWHVQTGNKGGFLSLDFGLEEYGVLDISQRLRHYRRFLYETGALDRGKGAVLKADVVDEESKNDYELSRINRFRYRTRYFTDSGIIGSKNFVTRVYNYVKHQLPYRKEKAPKPIKGLNGIYSLKKVSEK